MQAFNNASIFVLVSSLWMNSARGFTTSPVATTTSTSNPCTSITRLDEKPGWLDDAMEGIPSGEFDAESYKKGIDLKSGIAGFSTHPELGFVCILATKNESADEQHWIPAVISPVDKDRPKSAEALTCVQLAGGLDLGTAILPPGCLTKLVKDHTSEEEDSDEISSTARLSLQAPSAFPATTYHIRQK